MTRPLLLAALFLIVTPVLIATGCNIEPEMQRCVDYRDTVVEYSACQGGPQYVKVPGNINPMPRFRFYYGGFGSGEIGSQAWGGAEKPLSGHVYRAMDVDPDMAKRRANRPQPYVSAPIR